MKKIFEEIIASNTDVNYINATEGGIGIEGTKIKTFKQVLNENLLEKYDYNSFFNDFFRNNGENYNYKKILNTITDLEHKIDKMTKINNSRIVGLKKINRYLEKKLSINRIEKEIVYLNKYEEELRQIDAYKNCIKFFMDDIYKIVLNKFKYEGEDRKESIMSSKSILEIISYELKSYLEFFKTSIIESKQNVKL
ncbi:motility associated factor glycosyltransferase family protein [Clostridium arbusti]|uniref:motility associated factor glycosyltransferase family protein n=1 Tax=Clostridium arbusti TaxID=1137848 RepID=UPI0002893585|nr:motility associated factor glycosyltransferase family protein [Clostridium arbusti]